MLPGKKYKPEDFLQILRKRIWILLVPFAVVAAATAVVARKLPDRYRSDTLILVVPQKVPEAYVKSTVTTRIEDRLNSIAQQIMSRTRLERIIQDFDLYAEARRKGIMQDVVENMTRDIKIDIVKGDAFRVSYVGDNPMKVMKVTERLASLFIDENLRDREVLAENTNQFLEAQLEDARRRLMEHEKKLEEYRKRYSGQLPTQLDSNLQALQNTQVQIQNVIESLNRDRDRRIVVERQIADVQSEMQLVSVQPVQPANDTAPLSAAQQLGQARSTRQALELRFKPGHPDLAMWDRRIRDLEKKVEAEALSAPISGPTTPRAASTAELTRQRRLSDLNAEMENLDRQISAKAAEEARLRGIAAGYQQRVEITPTRETEMTELTRDYTTLQGMYTSLLAKKEDSKIAANLERRQSGEQFKVLDPARVPERPFSPDRHMINMMGIAAGLGIGLALIALLEYRDASFKTDDEVSALLALPVLAVVPAMASDAERRTRFRRQVVMSLGLGSTVAGCLALVAYTFIR